ncbi:TerB family tellurite resistance protein [Sorangium sp. So ce1078]|uniref:TerB family tellurite resistance protein n=1 Tax=unclassified Sorangium TaxID=2621164 RepID=UPI003F5F5BD1
MGIFDNFLGTNIQLTPKIALVATMLYLSAADGHLDDSEIGDLLKIVPDRQALDSALQYVRRVPFGKFLEESARLLSPQQKMCAILNAADLAMGDGHLAPAEQQMLNQVVQAWQIPEQYLGPYVQALMVKNNVAVFG